MHEQKAANWFLHVVLMLLKEQANTISKRLKAF